MIDQRMEFIAELVKDEESMTDLCHAFAISRKTGYKWRARYDSGGPAALASMSHRPKNSPRATPKTVVNRLLAMRAKHPTWGARKLRLLKSHPNMSWPAASTIHEVLRKAGVTRKPRTRRVVRFELPLVQATRPNEVWCMDFKGSFDCANGEHCHIFTVTDLYSRFILYCQAKESLSHDEVDRICDALMKKYGLPEHIRTDNGTPFCSMSGLGISKLTIKWLQLGIAHERIAPGKPTQNGRHERMHRTLKEDAASPPAETLTIQRERLEKFTRSFNNERPHQALEMKTPNSVYLPSAKKYPKKLAIITYGKEFVVRPIRGNGTIRCEGREIFISEVFSKQKIGLLKSADKDIEIYFGTLHLGTIDGESARFVPKRR